jgi:hypothetical protein
MYSSTLPSTSALDEGVVGQRHAPAALPPGKTPYPVYRRLGGPPGPVWTSVENLAPPPVFDPRTSIYTSNVAAPQERTSCNRPHKDRIGLLAGDLILLEKQTEWPAFVSKGVF